MMYLDITNNSAGRSIDCYPSHHHHKQQQQQHDVMNRRLLCSGSSVRSTKSETTPSWNRSPRSIQAKESVPQSYRCYHERFPSSASYNNKMQRNYPEAETFEELQNQRNMASSSYSTRKELQYKNSSKSSSSRIVTMPSSSRNATTRNTNSSNNATRASCSSKNDHSRTPLSTSTSSFASTGNIEDAIKALEDAFEDIEDDGNDDCETKEAIQDDDFANQHTHQAAPYQYCDDDDNHNYTNNKIAYGIYIPPTDYVEDFSSRHSVRFQYDESIRKKTHEHYNAEQTGTHHPDTIQWNEDDSYQHCRKSTTVSANTGAVGSEHDFVSLRVRQEEADLALAKRLQEEELKSLEYSNNSSPQNITDERAQIVQALLHAATEQAERNNKRRPQQQTNKTMHARVVQYVAPEQIAEERPPFSLVPDVLFGKDTGGDERKDVCAICFESLSSGTSVVLRVCGHIFHLDCIDDMLEHSKYCPQCRKCVRQDPQGKSPSGTLTVTRPLGVDLPPGVAPGSGADCNKRVIKMEYKMPDGFQKEYHDRPGVRFRGCTKVAYLPDTEHGRTLLERLIYAFNRGLTFQIIPHSKKPRGNDVVAWSSIPHMSAALDEKDDIQSLYYVACHEELDQLGVPRANGR